MSYLNKSILLVCLIFFHIDGNCALAEDLTIGTTFSQVQCEYLELDWQDTYIKTLNMGFPIIRLGAYWSRIEQEKDVYDFSELDWQIKKAKDKNTKVLLTVGMKAPRWPEYFIPSWIENDLVIKSVTAISDKPYLRERTLIFIRKIIERYSNEKIIVAWQVENEPLSRSGPNDSWIRREFLEEEIKLVKELDNKDRPIVINAMTYPNSFLRLLTKLIYKRNPIYETIDIAETPAINVYPTIGHKFFFKKMCFWTNPKKRIKYFKLFTDYAKFQDKDMWVTEIQAEPWEPGELVHMAPEEAITCRADSFAETFEELNSLGIKAIFLWGVEYWIFRDKKHQDKSWLEAFEKITKTN